MRLVSIELSGFRGFAQRQEFDLDADAVVVVGANGHGKTSLFDGILWALSGRLPRLKNDNSSLVSIYSETGQARVVMRLRGARNRRPYTVTRSIEGEEERVMLETPEATFQGPSAEGQLIDLIWPDAATASDSREAIATVLTRSVYLQQDTIRQFIDAASPQDRFTAISELLGAGRVTELQESLERSKKAWSTVTNQRHEELRPLRERLATIEARLSESIKRSSQALPAITADTWEQWWQQLENIGLRVSRVDAGSREAPSAISSAIKELDSLRRQTERRSQTLSLIRADIRKLADQEVPVLQPLRENVARLRQELEELKSATTDEQARLAELRRVQAESKEKDEQLKALAILALKHLAEHCPVCDQTYDRETTVQRLQRLARGRSSDTQAIIPPDKLNELLNAVAQKEKEASAAELALRTAERSSDERQMIHETIDQRLREAAVTSGDDRDTALSNAVSASETLITQLGELQQAGESLAVRLAQSSAMAGIDELRREATSLRSEVVEREKSVSAREKTGDMAQNVIVGLRTAGAVLVEEHLGQINSLLQSIWTRIDPHPAFRLVSFFSQVFRGKGQLSTIIRDPLEDKVCELPGTVLSSSQLNALAVSVFLALNIGIPNPPLPVAILDDPLQSLDDINLLGLVDIFRRTKDRRQFLVSTHDARFGGLLYRKLRPRDENGRTIVIELGSWRRQGPAVTTREVKSDPVPLRLVS